VNDRAGFSLIEFIIVLVIVAIVAVITGPLLLQSTQSANTQYELSTMDNQARLAVERMTKELRNINGNTNTDISNMQSGTITFNNTDGTVVTYSLTGSSLLRNTFILLENVSELAFAYYDASGNITATPGKVRYIQFQFVVTTPQGYSQTFGNTVYLRNAVY